MARKSQYLMPKLVNETTKMAALLWTTSFGTLVNKLECFSLSDIVVSNWNLKFVLVVYACL